MGDSNDDNNKNMNNLETAVTLEPPDVRESLVQTAVQFLQNPKTRASSLKLKILFLKKKGLTEDEIQLAIDRSGTALYEEAKNTVRDATQPPPEPLLPPHLVSNYHQQMAVPSQPRTPFTIVRDLANTVVALGSLGYLVYWVYKTFIQPWLFGGDGKKRRPVSDQLTDLDVTLTEVKHELRQGLARMGADIEAIANQRAAERSRDLNELSAQVQTVKGLLLNRSQFPAVPPTTLGSPAKIPSWQLAEESAAAVGNTGVVEKEDAENKMAAVKKQEGGEGEEEEEDDEEESSKSLAEASDSSLEMINSITNNHD